MSLEEEEAFLAPFFDEAKVGGILVVGEIKNALDQRLGLNVALASAHNLLHPHDWRNLAPDKRHPKSDGLVKSRKCSRIVIPVKTGIQIFQRVTKILDTGFHRCDNF